MEKRNFPDCNLFMNTVTRTLSSDSSIKRASLLKWVTHDLRLSSYHCLMFNRLIEDLLYLCPSIKWVTKCSLNSLKVAMVLGASLLNHTFAGSLSVVGNTMHIISSETPYRCIRVLNDFRWPSRSRELHMFPPAASGTWQGEGRKSPTL